MEQKTQSDDKLVYITLILSVVLIVCILILFNPTAEGAMCGKTCQAAKAKNMTVTEYREWLDNPKSVDTSFFFNNDRGHNFISIRISNSCKALDYCPTHKELADQFDNSNRYLSGDFFFDNVTETWKRENPLMYNDFEYYKYMNMEWVVWVNPSDYTWDRTKQIVIEPQLHYIDRRDGYENQVRIEYEGLNVDNCDSATIGWKNNGTYILLDVLNHFYSNCRTPLEYDPTREIFIESRIFEDCDKECFYHREQFQRELKVDQLISMEEWEKQHCNDEKVSEYTDITSYDRNKAECDRIRSTLDLDSKDDKKTCYGIYCENEPDKKELKTTAEKRAERLKELEEIQECKELQIWDEVKEEGKYRRLNYDCEDEEERNEYLKIMRSN